MHYVCLENDKVISIINYEPSVPASVTVVEISDEAYTNISHGTHIFDIASNSVVELSPEQIAQQSPFKQNSGLYEFLNSTDWKVLRHIREKALGITTSMTEQEYLTLEQQRQDVAKQIAQ